MMPVFADTSFYAALFHRRDHLHDEAQRIWADLGARVVTTEFVLAELGALMRREPLRRAFVDFVASNRADATTEIAPASTESFDGGLLLFAERPDKEWSLTDCISFYEMRRRGIVEALMSDAHFTQAGFRVLLSP